MRQTGWFALWVLVLDQFTKWLILGGMLPGESIALLGDLVRITYVRNSAGLMGIDLFGSGTLLLLSLPALGFIIWFWWRSHHLPAAYSWLLAGIAGGATGNFIDRLWHGWVVDFIDVDFPDINLPQFQLLGFQFPGFQLDRWWVFNVADSFIFVGILLLFLVSLLTDHAKDSPRNVH